jgi:hypothetical protein
MRSGEGTENLKNQTEKTPSYRRALHRQIENLGDNMIAAADKRAFGSVLAQTKYLACALIS